MSVEASPEAASDHWKVGLADLLSRRDRELLKRQSCSQWELVGVGAPSVVWMTLMRIPGLSEPLEQTGSLSLENLSPPKINSW